MRKLSLAARLAFVILGLAMAPASHADWFKEERAIMGTSIVAELWSADADKAHKGIAAVMREMHRIDALMSPFRKDSELSKVNREAADHPIKISRGLFKLIASLCRNKERNLQFELSRVT